MSAHARGPWPAPGPCVHAGRRQAWFAQGSTGPGSAPQELGVLPHTPELRVQDLQPERQFQDCSLQRRLSCVNGSRQQVLRWPFAIATRIVGLPPLRLQGPMLQRIEVAPADVMISSAGQRSGWALVEGRKAFPQSLACWLHHPPFRRGLQSKASRESLVSKPSAGTPLDRRFPQPRIDPVRRQ